MPGPYSDYARRLVADDRRLGELFDGDLFIAAVAAAGVLNCDIYFFYLPLELPLALLFACLLEVTESSLIEPLFFSSSSSFGVHDLDSSTTVST